MRGPYKKAIKILFRELHLFPTQTDEGHGVSFELAIHPRDQRRIKVTEKEYDIFLDCFRALAEEEK